MDREEAGELEGECQDCDLSRNATMGLPKNNETQGKTQGTKINIVDTILGWKRVSEPGKKQCKDFI